AASDQPQQHIAAGALVAAGRSEDTPLVDDRRDAADAADVAVVTPQKTPITSRDAHNAAAQELDILPDAADLGDHDRCVAGLVAARHFRLPANAAVLLVEGQQRGTRPARRADESLAINEHRFGIRPGAAVALELLFQVVPPDHLAIGGADTDQVAVGAQRVEP